MVPREECPLGRFGGTLEARELSNGSELNLEDSMMGTKVGKMVTI